MLEPVRLVVERLGRRGEGVATLDGRTLYIPYALPGDTVLADIDGERGHLIELLAPSPDRGRPICPHFGTCGGCAVQALASGSYAEWKRGLVVRALRQAGLEADVAPLVDAHGEGRRRVTFHARAGSRHGPVELGFMAARSHRIVEIEACPVLAPPLAGAVAAARGVAEGLAETGKPLDILVTATDGGLDVDIRGVGRLDEALTRRLIVTADTLRLARLSNHGRGLVEHELPVVRMGRASLKLPPGAFLQATLLGEETLAREVLAGIGTATNVVDLFCGVGTFALRLAERAAVSAWDGDADAVDALDRAARAAPGLRPVTAAVRDLFRRPLLVSELDAFEVAVLDPPRAGAAAQCAELAYAAVPTIVAVSCDPGTLARDAATLVAGGYALERVVPVDQFRYSTHIEIVAVFRRRKAAARKRRLLS